MSIINDPQYLECTIHELKTHISRYLRLPDGGAGGGTRTPTGKSPTDFKSVASTIPPRPQSALSIASVHAISKRKYGLRPENVAVALFAGCR